MSKLLLRHVYFYLDEEDKKIKVVGYYGDDGYVAEMKVEKIEKVKKPKKQMAR